jgi:hypothetical protein
MPSHVGIVAVLLETQSVCGIISDEFDVNGGDQLFTSPIMDWHSWRLHCATDRYYGRGSAIPHRVRSFRDLAFYSVFRDIGGSDEAVPPHLEPMLISPPNGELVLPQMRCCLALLYGTFHNFGPRLSAPVAVHIEMQAGEG